MTLVHGGKTRGHMHHTRIDAPGLFVDALEPRNLVLGRKRRDRIGGQIELMPCLRVPRLHPPLATVSRNSARGARCFLQGRQNDFIRIGESGLLARQGADADALLDAGAAVLDHAVLQRPGLLVCKLEIEVGEVHGMGHHVAEDAIDARVIEATRSQDQIACDAQRVGDRNGGRKARRSVQL